MKSAKKLCGDRGEGDPVLTIAAMAATLIVAGGMLTGIGWAVRMGAEFVSEQTAAMTLSTARKAWQQDAANASIVQVKDETEASFYEVPGQLPGMYMPRDGAGINPTTCRKSTWTLADGALKNLVQKFSNATCDLDDSDAKSTPTSATELTGLQDAKIVSFNDAGRDLHFRNFQEVGLTADNPESQSTAERDSWWHDYEWDFDSPKRINVVGRLKSAISSEREALIAGTTNLAPTSAGQTSEVDPNAELRKYKPGKIDFSMTRGKTGTVVAGARESLRVQITDIADCGPYNVTYWIDVKPSTSGVAKKSKKLVAFKSPAAVEFTGIPNGSVGTVSLKASCPAHVQDGAASTKSKSFTQTLPKPKLTARQKGPNDLHQVSWAKVSSLGSVKYELQGAPGRSGWRKIGIYDPGLMDVTWRGAAIGATTKYRVLASLGKVSSTSNQPSVHTPWQKPGEPAVSIRPSVVNSGQSFNVTVGTTCPKGTITHYRATGGGSTWTSRSFSHRRYVSSKAQVFSYSSTITCSSTWGGTSPRSGGSSASVTVKQPVPRAPSSYGLVANSSRGNQSSGMGGGTVFFSVGGSAGATTYQVTAQARVGLDWSSNSYSGGATSNKLIIVACSAQGLSLSRAVASFRAGNSTGWSSWVTRSTGARQSLVPTC